MKKFYIASTSDPKDAISINADYFVISNEQLLFFYQYSENIKDVEVIGVFKSWNFFVEMKE
jgi:hypothetical protein